VLREMMALGIPPQEKLGIRKNPRASRLGAQKPRQLGKSLTARRKKALGRVPARARRHGVRWAYELEAGRYKRGGRASS